MPAIEKQTLGVMTRRQIEAMPYGSAEQLEAADRWFARYIEWDSRREDRWLAGHAYRKLLLRDVWYIANQRSLYLSDDER